MTDPKRIATSSSAIEVEVETDWASNLKRIKWAFLASLVLLLVFMEFSRYLLKPHLDTVKGRLVMDLVVLVGGVFLFGALFEVIARMNTRLGRQNRELLALHRAGLDIYGEASLKTVLQKVVDQARVLLETKYGALAVYDDNGTIDEFVASGISRDIKKKIGDPPVGKGLLGHVLIDGQQIIIPSIASDPRSHGFPPNHPPMKSLLAVPIVCSGPFRGNLYVSERLDGGEFSRADSASLNRFATASAIAIDNAYLNQQLSSLAIAQERVRIAAELHDGMAQVLAYVNTKAQAVQAYLEKDDFDTASRQLDQLAAAARDVYQDAREGIMALRTGISPEQSFDEALEGYLSRWQEQSGMKALLETDRDTDLPPSSELQVLRVIQEALTNARKHSRGSRVTVTLRSDDGWLQAIVHDDGTGFDPTVRTRAEFPQFGLGIMNERAESIGGKFEIESGIGKGTRVKIRVPTESVSGTTS